MQNDRIRRCSFPTRKLRRARLFGKATARKFDKPTIPLPTFAATLSGYDFWTSASADELARSQGVQPIRRLGQVRTFSDPNPVEADWFAREVRRWRHETGRTQQRNRR